MTTYRIAHETFTADELDVVRRYLRARMDERDLHNPPPDRVVRETHACPECSADVPVVPDSDWPWNELNGLASRAPVYF